MNEKIKNIAALSGGHLWKVLLFAAFVWLAVSAAGFSLRTGRVEGRVADAIKAYQSLDKLAKDAAAASATVPEDMKKRNLFAPPGKKPGLPTCTGLLGDKAFIDGKWYKAGDTAGGVKIVSVGAKDVTVLLEGVEKKLVPFDVAVEYGSGQGKPKESSRPAERGGPSPSGPVENAGAGQEAGGQARPGGKMKMPPEMKAQMMEQLQKMPPEQREQALKQIGEKYDIEE